ncbi:MAG: hypothetical protein CL920_21220 [Deltaproteobacteria bacterium]|nr:hypothetical protein [Deltaproteobacteria bacterium]
MFVRLIGPLLGLFLLLSLTQACSQQPPCVGDVGSQSIDPNQSPCTQDCECNNQRFSGTCADGVCSSIAREECQVPGQTRTCKLEASPNGCADGVQTCKPQELNETYWGNCRPRAPEKEDSKETCSDGLDNDCDGKVDKFDSDCEGKVCIPGNVRPCYDFEGQKVDEKTKSQGICREGQQSCTLESKWGPCIGAVYPEETEACDKKDNNCDGSVDEGCECDTPGQERNCYEGPSGTANKGLCKEGTQTCIQGKWSKCVGAVTPQTEECNKKDDNCDGSVDEGCECIPGEQESCYTGTPETTKSNEPCKTGFHTCLPTGKWGTCQGQVIPQTETCNGVDDDCNGKVDDSADCECWPPGSTTECYTGPLSSKGKGVCALGSRRCLSSGKWASVCEGEVVPKTETCNGLDDDCNGSVDDASKCECWPPGQTQECYTGPLATKGKGLCSVGIQRCQADGTWSKSCEGQILPATEECNGKDDDCDGAVDGASVCQCWPPGSTQQCFDGIPTASRGKGICSAGTQECSTQGKWGTCFNVIKPQKEECNLKDDDCDGSIDNNPGNILNTLTRPCYSGRTGCVYQADGTFKCNANSSCKAGRQVCINGNWQACQGESLPEVEVCNGKDDDCDGQIDNNVTDPPLCEKQRGPCRGAKVTTGCVNGRWAACADADYKKHFAQYSTTETCDNYDNDCDGRINEDVLNCVGTLAGGGSRGQKDGFASDATFYTLRGVTTNKDGNAYVTDGNTIRKIDPCGNVSLFAGTGAAGFTDGSGKSARFDNPFGITIASNGHLFVADRTNHRIREITKDGIVSTFAGTGSPGSTNGSAQTARLSQPLGVAFGPLGALFFTQYSSGLRKISGGNVSNVTSVGRQGFADGPANIAKLDRPTGIFVAGKDLIYIADTWNNKIRKVTGGMVSTYVSNLTLPQDLTGDTAGNLYVVGTGSSKSYLYKIDPTGTLTTLGGGNNGYMDGPLSSVRFSGISGVTMTPQGDLLIVGNGGRRIRTLKLNPNSITHDFCVLPYLGAMGSGDQDGPLETAKFNDSYGIYADKQGNIYIADTDNNKIRKVDAFGNVTTVAGSTRPGSTDGPSHVAQFDKPQDLVKDSKGNLYVADTNNDSIRKIDPQGNVTTLVGGTKGYRDGPASIAQFDRPLGIAIDRDDNLYVTYSYSGAVRKVSYVDSGACGGQKNYTGYCVTTYAGKNKRGFADGPAASALFNEARGMVVDSQGNLFVADHRNHRIRKISVVTNATCGSQSNYTGRCVTTFAGSGAIGGKDGTGAQAQFNRPYGMTIDNHDNLYVVDRGGRKVRKIDPQGHVTTLAGSGANSDTVGPGPTATFSDPRAITYGPNRVLYILSTSALMRKLPLP